jgi:hypothetical protein
MDMQFHGRHIHPENLGNVRCRRTLDVVQDERPPFARFLGGTMRSPSSIAASASSFMPVIRRASP